MRSDEIKRITIIGAGVMGHSIAQIAAGSGYNVTIQDIEKKYIDGAKNRIEGDLKRNIERGRMTEKEAKNLLHHLSFTLDFVEAVKSADLVVEAIPEKLDLKKQVWAKLSTASSEDAILTTNTSSLSITEIAKAVSNPKRFLGMHFFNPPAHMHLVEIIPGVETDLETVETVKEVAKKLGKTPVVVKKDVVGFIVNRVLITYLNEAAKLVESSEWTVQQVDSAMQYRAKMPLGPFMLSDLIGLDIVYNILKVFEENLGEEYAPGGTIKKFFNEQKLGRKTGRGFYSYIEKPFVSEEEGKGFDINLLLNPLFAEAEKVVADGIADRESVDVAMKLGANLPKGPFEWKEAK
jgi:enoyl-CoA hydratase/3-hydroxyacyl-CoA dehydrogenase